MKCRLFEGWDKEANIRNTKSSAEPKTNTETSAKEDRDKDEKDKNTMQTVSKNSCGIW